MARRKSDAERGVFGAWAYNTRDALNLSVEAVVAALPATYHPATLRKVEGGSSGLPPSARMWRELGNLYAGLADEEQVAIDAQPRLPVEATAPTSAPDLAAAMWALTAELEAIRLEREAWTHGVAAVLRSYEDGRVPVDLLDALVPPRRVDARP